MFLAIHKVTGPSPQSAAQCFITTQNPAGLFSVLPTADPSEPLPACEGFCLDMRGRTRCVAVTGFFRIVSGGQASCVRPGALAGSGLRASLQRGLLFFRGALSVWTHGHLSLGLCPRSVTAGPRGVSPPDLPGGLSHQPGAAPVSPRTGDAVSWPPCSSILAATALSDCSSQATDACIFIRVLAIGLSFWAKCLF